jgi:hypothetical protein
MSTSDTMSSIDVLPENPSVRPAFPVAQESAIHSEWNGLSKREYVATHLLSGLLARGAVTPGQFTSLAELAVSEADELLKILQEASS